MMTPDFRPLGLATALVVGLTACTPTTVPTRLETDVTGPLPNPDLQEVSADACMSSIETPAVIETVTELVMIQDVTLNADGTVLHPAVYGNETRQQIVQDRDLIEFATPCPELLTTDLKSSVQRALQARGYYDGPITGEFDDLTTAAIQAFQFDQNDIDTGVLTLRTARTLGLVAIPRDTL